MFSPSFFLSKSICTGDLRLLPLMNFFFLLRRVSQSTYISKCGYCLEVWFNRCAEDNVKSSEATNDGREGEHRCRWMCIWTNSLFLFRLYLHPIFFLPSLPPSPSTSFFLHMLLLWKFFFCSISPTSNKMTNISARTTQTRAYIHIHTSARSFFVRFV